MTNYSLFELYVRDGNPFNQTIIDNVIQPCHGMECEKCTIINICHNSTAIPDIDILQLEKFKLEYPEYFK